MLGETRKSQHSSMCAVSGSQATPGTEGSGLELGPASYEFAKTFASMSHRPSSYVYGERPRARTVRASLALVTIWAAGACLRLDSRRERTDTPPGRRRDDNGARISACERVEWRNTRPALIDGLRDNKEAPGLLAT